MEDRTVPFHPFTVIILLVLGLVAAIAWGVVGFFRRLREESDPRPRR